MAITTPLSSVSRRPIHTLISAGVLALALGLGASTVSATAAGAGGATQPQDKVGPVGIIDPQVAGVLAVGHKVTAVTHAAKGATFTYQWLRHGQAIKGATAKTYRLTEADARNFIAVRVKAKAKGTTTTAATSAHRTVSPRTAGVERRPVTVKGVVRVGQTLTASTATWRPAPVALEYAWWLDGIRVAKGQTNSYTLAPADVGKYLQVVVRGSAATKLAQAIAVKNVGPVEAAPLTGLPDPVIGGIAAGTAIRAGLTLRADHDALPDGVAVTYSWLSDGQPIAGATGRTYVITAADAGTNLSVAVAFSALGYTPASKASPSVAVEGNRNPVTPPRPAPKSPLPTH